MAPSTASAATRVAEDPTGFPSLAAMPLADVLRLARTPRVGPITFFHLIRRFGSAAAALSHLPEMAQRGGAHSPLVPCTSAQAEQEIEATQRHGAWLIRYGEPEYPALLRHIADPPPVITVFGQSEMWKAMPIVAMVGARNASANGCAFAQKLARELGAEGFTVVSGLARGIDTFAHRGALTSGTVAVIASGIDHVYPPENESLYRQIAQQGAIISEQPFGSLPYAGSFPGRNRIIAGMCAGTVVVEASLKSGSLITARFALEQGREVFAVPGSPMDPRAQGCNRLLKDGAQLVETAADVAEALRRPLALHEHVPPDFYPAAAIPYSEDELAQARERVLSKCGHTPVSVDELLTQCQVTYGVLFTVLIELELAGRLQRLPGNQVCLRYTD